MMAETNDVEIPDDLTVEVVDDTPEEDKGRKPLPEVAAKQLEAPDDDELDGDVEEVRQKAKERIKIAKKAWHDERRAKEESIRIAEEATKMVKGYQARTLEQQQRLVNGEQYLITQMQEKARNEVVMAKAAYKAAYESGDSDALANAQEILSRATANAMQTEQWKPTQQSTLQALQNEVQQQTQAQAVPAPTRVALDERAQEWAERNPWFGKTDAIGKKMTGYAYMVHQTLVEDGIDPKSDEYYRKIDREMRERFPEVLSGDNAGQSPAATVVAPVQRSAKGKRVTLTHTQLALARRLGLTNEQYARELIKTHREYANG